MSQFHVDYDGNLKQLVQNAQSRKQRTQDTGLGHLVVSDDELDSTYGRTVDDYLAYENLGRAFRSARDAASGNLWTLFDQFFETAKNHLQILQSQTDQVIKNHDLAQELAGLTKRYEKKEPIDIGDKQGSLAFNIKTGLRDALLKADTRRTAVHDIAILDICARALHHNGYIESACTIDLKLTHAATYLNKFNFSAGRRRISTFDKLDQIIAKGTDAQKLDAIVNNVNTLQLIANPNNIATQSNWANYTISLNKLGQVHKDFAALGDIVANKDSRFTELQMSLMAIQDRSAHLSFFMSQSDLTNCTTDIEREQAWGRAESYLDVLRKNSPDHLAFNHLTVFAIMAAHFGDFERSYALCEAAHDIFHKHRQYDGNLNDIKGINLTQAAFMYNLQAKLALSLDRADAFVESSFLNYSSIREHFCSPNGDYTIHNVLAALHDDTKGLQHKIIQTRNWQDIASRELTELNGSHPIRSASWYAYIPALNDAVSKFKSK